jgi:pyocin large subunit-like protein
MSYAAMDWVCEQTIADPQAKYVLLMVAKHVNNQWQAWPSAQRLAELTGLNERTVRRKLTDLKKAGYIFIETRNVGGRQSSNMMTIQRKGGQTVSRGRAERPPNIPKNKNNISSVIRGADSPPKSEGVDFLAMANKAMGKGKTNGN